MVASPSNGRRKNPLYYGFLVHGEKVDVLPIDIQLRPDLFEAATAVGQPSAEGEHDGVENLELTGGEAGEAAVDDGGQISINAPGDIDANTVETNLEAMTGGDTESGDNDQTKEPLEMKIENFDISPTAFDLAAKNGVDLNQVEGTGANGRILVKDVEGAIG